MIRPYEVTVQQQAAKKTPQQIASQGRRDIRKSNRLAA